MEHIRLNFLTADPVRFHEATAFVTDEVKPVVEKEPGCLGLSMSVDPTLAVALITSYWVSREAMRANAKASRGLRDEAVRRSGGTVTVEHYEVSSKAREVRPPAGAGVRVTRADLDPRRVEDAIAAYEDDALPWLTAAEGFCSAHLFVHRATGHAVQETVWADADGLARSRSRVAALRAETVAATGVAIRSLSEYQLVFAPTPL